MATETTPTPPNEPRRAFQNLPEPEPFYRTAEFRRFFGIFGVLFLVGAGAFYYANLQERRGAEQEASRVAALVPRHKLEPEEVEQRRTALLAQFEGAFADTENGQALNRQSSGYFKLLETLIRYSPEEVHAKATRDLDIDAAMADPDAWRGEWVRARGVVGDMWTLKLARPVLGRTDVYRVPLTNGERPFYVDLTEKDPAIDFRREIVDVEGLFYRTVKFESAEGKTLELPQLLARTMRIVPPAAASGLRALSLTGVLGVVGGIAFVILFGALLLYRFQKASRRTRMVHDGPRSASFQDMFDQRLRREGQVPPQPKPK